MAWSDPAIDHCYLGASGWGWGFSGCLAIGWMTLKGSLRVLFIIPMRSSPICEGAKGDNPWIFQVSLNPEGNGDQGSFKNVTNDGNMFNNPVYGFERGHSKIEIKALVNKVDFP